MTLAKKILVGIICISLTNLTHSIEWYESHVIILESLSAIDPNPDDISTYFSTDAEARRKQIELALIANRKYILELYSMVLYGYKFVYVPSDNLRGIIESWTLEPIAKIISEDANLHEVDRQIYDAQLSIIYRYNLISSQITWLKGWELVEILPSGGIGVAFASDIDAVEAKVRALQNAIKGAVRDRLRKQIPTKPLEVTGMVKLESQPHVYKSGEYYNAKVRVKIKVDNIKAQQVF